MDRTKEFNELCKGQVRRPVKCERDELFMKFLREARELYEETEIFRNFLHIFCKKYLGDPLVFNKDYFKAFKEIYGESDVLKALFSTKFDTNAQRSSSTMRLKVTLQSISSRTLVLQKLTEKRAPKSYNPLKKPPLPNIFEHMISIVWHIQKEISYDAKLLDSLEDLQRKRRAERRSPFQAFLPEPQKIREQISVPSDRKLVLEKKNTELLREMGSNDLLEETAKTLQDISAMQAQISQHISIQTDVTARLGDESIQTVNRISAANWYLENALRHLKSAFLIKFFVPLIASLILLSCEHS